ncbi:MAG TPA: hypothetical protein VGK21_15740, partial [Candidatus Angelobacter sp.]
MADAASRGISFSVLENVLLAGMVTTKHGLGAMPEQAKLLRCRLRVADPDMELPPLIGMCLILGGSLLSLRRTFGSPI